MSVKPLASFLINSRKYFRRNIGVNSLGKESVTQQQKLKKIMKKKLKKTEDEYIQRLRPKKNVVLK